MVFREMAEVANLVSARNIKLPGINPANPRSSKLVYSQSFRIKASSKRNDFSLINKKNSRRSVIRISTADGRWHGNWGCDYLLSLQDLRLGDLVEEDDGNKKDAQVSVNLSVHKHASFGFSVDGRILTSFTRKCSNCSSPYCRKIDTQFNVWVLSSSRDDNTIQLPEIGGDDPSVIYVKPGNEAELDSLVQDSIRLATSIKDTCSELCEKSYPTVQYIGGESRASIDKRWSRLLELKNLL
ncbi:large ribosomal RNA subunit accumulation protein YCED homolog 2, chloroplastic [Rosa rugosa]|uniref:large ribosomal RNA subunit accumulation protein YCED homolog 2, chloroplastic n=1 Tax=Rosa rugosa TaxID=74645 RepID=UPI002B40CE35|nr:large ribosomal RNA subunit accumulation protein YCED homolog 2, chloroplastic [Rosa rugosa]